MAKSIRSNLLNGGGNKSGKGAPKNAVEDDFYNFFNGGMSLKKLKPGQYDCKLISATFVTPDAKPGKEINQYVKLDLQLADRIITDNRFKNNFRLALDQIKEQLGMEDEEIPVQELLTKLKETSFSLWISYARVQGKTYRNIDYLAPIEDEDEDEEIDY